VIRLKGMSGKVILDDNGDREPDYWITDMAPNGTFIKITEVLKFGLNRRVSHVVQGSTCSFRCAFDVSCYCEPNAPSPRELMLGRRW